MTPNAAPNVAATLSVGNAEQLDHAINRAIDSLRDEQTDACVAACETALDCQPQCPEALLLLGLTSLSLGEPAHAITLIEQAYAKNDRFSPFAQALAVAHAHIGNVNDGLFYAKLATTLPPHPKYPDILPSPFDNFLSNLEDARPFLYRSRATTSLEAGRFADAIDAASKQLSMSPGDPQSLRLLGRASTAAGATERAIATGHALVHGDPVEADDFALLGAALTTSGQWSEAANAYRAARHLAPDDPALASAQIANAVCDPAVSPSAAAALHSAWQTRFAPAARPRATEKRDPAKPLRIGYLSNAFHAGEVAQLIMPVLDLHGAAGAETYCYADGCRGDLITERIINTATRWTDLTGVDDLTAAAILVGDDLDIAIDLTGHGPGSRLRTLAHSAVPVTAGWFAYPHPSGLDHFVATETLWPTGDAEPSATGDAVAYLPRVWVPFHPPAIMPDVSPAPVMANGHVTFGINGNLAHIGAPFAAACHAVLSAHPTARLLIGNDRNLDDFAINRCYETFANVGLRHRVDIVDAAANFANPFEFYHHVDIALASGPVTSVVETCQALWMGVPVLCTPSDRPAGRAAAATLVAAGCEAWVAATDTALPAIAADLCAVPDDLAKTRGELRGRVSASPLADVATATRELEGLYCRLIADAQPA